MNKLIKKIGDEKTEVKKLINSRIEEFKEIGRSSEDKVFEELCFCILTANFSAEKSIKIQKEIGSGFLTLSKNNLIKKLREHGHRYPKTRATYIMEAKKRQKEILNVIKHLKGEELREWFVKNIKGLGYKEASHFLSNIGFDDYAIIDFHIIELLTKYKIIKRPKTLTKKKYLEIEKILREIARKTKLTLAELDLYLWYMETGKILK